MGIKVTLLINFTILKKWSVEILILIKLITETFI